MEGALGPRKRTGKARRAAKCIPCLETTKVSSMASLIKFTGSSGQERGWKNGERPCVLQSRNCGESETRMNFRQEMT